MTAPSILIVEDDPALRLLTARALRDYGYDVGTAATGAEMWVMLEAGNVDLVVLDIMLPGASGIELLRRLRKDSETPVIFVSARGSEEDRVLGLELGADDYLPKPFGTRELAARVAAVLRRRGTGLAEPESDKSGDYVFAGHRLIELSRMRMGDSSDRSIDVLVSRLRRKLGDSAPIATVRGVGYMLTAEVERL